MLVASPPVSNIEGCGILEIQEQFDTWGWMLSYLDDITNGPFLMQSIVCTQFNTSLTTMMK